MTASSVRYRCSGCDTSIQPSERAPFACPRRAAAENVDHVVEAVLDTDTLPHTVGSEENPFLRYREWLPFYRTARDHGLADQAYCDLVETLDEAVAAVDGRGFRQTPYHWGDALGVWYKDETAQVSGSHKSRHLMGLGIYLELAGKLDLAGGGDRPLAIASCGNAALAAAVIARALDRPLHVFIPPWAKASIRERLTDLGATQVVCERSDSLPPGDPCVHHYRQSVAAGAIPFACQGNENGLAIAGGMTLAFELVDQHAASGAPALERIFIQVGGGALASSTMQAYALASRLGGVPLPRFTCVQTANAHPLEPAWRELARRAASSSAAEALDYARRHRAEFMRPWPEEPTSIASGILDDETYDWWSIGRGLLASAGDVALVDEETIAAAAGLARSSGIEVCATGAAGYAGVIAGAKEIAAAGGTAVFFTGARR